MEQLTNLALGAIDRYFNSLLTLGYKSYNDVEKLLILLFIEELLSGEFAFFITESDYRIIMDSVYCLAGSNCMIDYPQFLVFDSLTHDSKLELISKITEDNNIRVSDTSIRDKA